jgi:DNA (cytosine-5)-methyltransferase 1
MRVRNLSEIVIDCFAGGGGTSHGIELATGRSPHVALNHCGEALKMHAANHPRTKHVQEDVWRRKPQDLARGKPVGLATFSPDCRHFSVALGGAKRSRRVRALAWSVVWHVKAYRPRIIIVENVREFTTWGPLLADGQPDPLKNGNTFKAWVRALKREGYVVEWRVLDAADYGVPTHRRRLFIIARNDGEPICWPEPTHAAPKDLAERPLIFAGRKPHRTAAECIDWSLPCPSIFDRQRPLAEATLRRIALGVKRYVLDSPRPFLVTINHGGAWFRDQDLGEPMGVVTGSRGQAIVTPVIAKYHGQSSPGDHHCTPADEPLRTVDTENRHAVLAPCLARIGQTGGNGKCCNGPAEPLTTVTSKAEHLLVCPTLVQTGYGERPGQAPRVPGLEKPLGTSVNGQKHALVAAYLAKHFGGAVGASAERPLPTQTVRGTQTQVVAANLVHFNHGEKQWSGCDEPARTVTTGNHAFLVYSFLTKYFGTAIGCPLGEPAPTVTGKDRFGMVTVTIDGELFIIVDIGMRMLSPRELARANGFPDSYVLTGSKSSQVARIGNSVPPPVIEALVRANYQRRTVRVS